MKKKYDKEFKIQTIRLIQEQGKTVAQVARDLGLSENTLYRWIAEFKQDGNSAFVGSGQLKSEDKAMRELQKMIQDLGNCYDNACIESFHSVLKKELVYLEKYKTREQAKKSIFEYITCFYNGKRIHSSIGYLSPNNANVCAV